GGDKMRLGLVVNDIKTEEAGYTTCRLAIAAMNLGHEVWVMGVGDLAYDPSDSICARATRAPKSKYKTTEAYLKDVLSSKAIKERITVDDLDVLLLRNDPSSDAISRPWASGAGIVFGRAAMRHGVAVFNDPNGLAKATNKMYFQTFPEELRPRTLITRDKAEIKAFAKEEGGSIVLKPLQGSGGDSVFLVRPEDVPNLNQMIDAVSRDGYVIAQEYLPAAAEGDMRLFIMNGLPLRHKGKYAAFRRVRTGGDMRSNIHAGGKLRKADIDASALRIAEIVRPKLVQDGMFLVGLDIVGDKVMEINVFSPGGLGSAQKFEGVNFSRAVITALERKVQYGAFYHRNFDNVDLATL
ncbi:glutathione synthetase, partial [Gemmatimonadota bacterium]